VRCISFLAMILEELLKSSDRHALEDAARWRCCGRLMAPRPLVAQWTSTAIHVNEMTMITAHCSCAATDPQFLPLVAPDIPVLDDLVDPDRTRLVHKGPRCRYTALVCDSSLVYNISSYQIQRCSLKVDPSATELPWDASIIGYYGSWQCSE